MSTITARPATGRSTVRIGLAAGAAGAVLLWFVGVLTLENFGELPEDATAAQFATYFREDEVGIYVGALLFFLGSIVFLWWSSLVRSLVASAEGGATWLSTALFGSAVAVVVLSMGLLAPQMGGAFAANESEAPLEAAAAQALYYAADGLFVASAYAAASFVIAVLVASWRFGLLPKPLTWLSVPVALLLLLPVINWIGLIFAWPIWILLVGSMLRTEGRAAGDPRR